MNSPAASPAIISPVPLTKFVDKAHATGSEDSEIVKLTRGLAAENEDAFRRFHELYFDRLFRYALVISQGNEDTARETLQETFLRVIRHAKRFDNEQGFWTWLTVIVRSAAIDGGRKQRRYTRLLRRYALSWFGTDAAQASSPTTNDSLDQGIGAALKQLPALDRRLIESKYYDGDTVRQIAHDNALTEKAVESRLLRARRTLRNLILEQTKQ